MKERERKKNNNLSLIGLHATLCLCIHDAYMVRTQRGHIYMSQCVGVQTLYNTKVAIIAQIHTDFLFISRNFESLRFALEGWFYD